MAAPADVMPRWLFAAVFGLLSAAAPAAEELDAEFLEYLAHLEGDDDDWTLIAATEEVQPPPEDADAKGRDSTSKASKPADRTAADDK